AWPPDGCAARRPYGRAGSAPCTQGRVPAAHPSSECLGGLADLAGLWIYTGRRLHGRDRSVLAETDGVDDLLLDLAHHLGVLAQEALGVVAALTEPLVA